VQENHYDPWGLNLAGIEKQGNPGHKFQFQGQEKQEDLGLNWTQFKWRMHDPQLGRFTSIDPLSEQFYYNSTYAFSENKVTSHIELEGLESVSMHVIKAATSPKTTQSLQKASEAGKQMVSVKGSVQVGLGLEGKAGGAQFGYQVSFFNVEGTANGSSQTAEMNVVKVEAQAGYGGKYSVGGQAKGGKLVVGNQNGQSGVLESHENLEVTGQEGMSEQVLGVDVGGSRDTDGNNTVGVSGKAGVLGGGVELNLNAVGDYVNYSIEAVQSFFSSFITSMTNNAFGTDDQNRTQRQYIEDQVVNE
jgi:RHS repeat-associated protein